MNADVLEHIHEKKWEEGWYRHSFSLNKERDKVRLLATHKSGMREHDKASSWYVDNFVIRKLRPRSEFNEDQERVLLQAFQSRVGLSFVKREKKWHVCPRICRRNEDSISDFMISAWEELVVLSRNKLLGKTLVREVFAYYWTIEELEQKLIGDLRSIEHGEAILGDSKA